MSIKKQFLKTRPICKVTFRLDADEVSHVDSVHITGDFNDWDKRKTPMKRLKDGSFTITLDLPANHDYQFRYFIDEETWLNDAEADRYIPSGFAGSDNSVVSV